MQRRSSSRAGAALRGVALLVAMLAGGCAPTWHDFKMPSGGGSDAAIAGRLTVLYNGQVFTENCFAYFGQERYRLSTGGVVLFRVAKGWTAFERLECKDTSMQHVRIRGAHFLARGDGYVTDFGDVAISWHTVGGFKVANMFGLIGAIVDESMDDGAAIVEVKPPVVEVRAAFRQQTGGEGRWVVAQLSQPASHDPQPDGDRAAPPPPEGGGFFCTHAQSPRGELSVCERDQPACEHVRGVLGPSAAACTPAETAWCVASGGKLRCAATQRACASQVDSAAQAYDTCGEQY